MPSSVSRDQTCARSEEHTSELQSHDKLVCRLLLVKKNAKPAQPTDAGTPPTALCLQACGLSHGPWPGPAPQYPRLVLFFNVAAAAGVFVLPPRVFLPD